jgi:hypothetical protein
VRVQRVVSPDDETESWTVLADDWTPVEPVELFLAHLTDQERSPNTVKAYAHDLKDYFEYLEGRQADWRRLRFRRAGEVQAVAAAVAGAAPWRGGGPIVGDPLLRGEHGQPQDRGGHELL